MKKIGLGVYLVLAVLICVGCNAKSATDNNRCNCLGAFCDGNTHIQWTGCAYNGDNGEKKTCSDAEKCVPFDGCLKKCTSDDECKDENDMVCAAELGVCVTKDNQNAPDAERIKEINEHIQNSSKSCE